MVEGDFMRKNLNLLDTYLTWGGGDKTLLNKNLSHILDYKT